MSPANERIIMERKELLKSPNYWISKIQLGLYDCADEFMERHGMNRTQLAEHLNVSKGYVSQLLNGDYDHRLSKFVELALAFGYIPSITFTPMEEYIAQEKYSYKGVKSWTRYSYSGEMNLCKKKSYSPSDYGVLNVKSNQPKKCA